MHAVTALGPLVGVQKLLILAGNLRETGPWTRFAENVVRCGSTKTFDFTGNKHSQNNAARKGYETGYKAETSERILTITFVFHLPSTRRCIRRAESRSRIS